MKNFKKCEFRSWSVSARHKCVSCACACVCARVSVHLIGRTLGNTVTRLGINKNEDKSSNCGTKKSIHVSAYFFCGHLSTARI